MLQGSVDGSLEAADRAIEDLATTLREQGATHYQGVALLNRSILATAMGDPGRALEHASAAVAHLDASSAGIELVSAHVAQAVAYAFLGEIHSARKQMAIALERASARQVLEVTAEIAEVEALFGETSHAWPLVQAAVDGAEDAANPGEQLLYARALLSMRDGDFEGAKADIAKFRLGRPTDVIAFDAKKLLAEGLLVALSDGRVSQAVSRGMRRATAQGARFWVKYAEVIALLAGRERDPSAGLIRIVDDCPAAVSSLAELVVNRLTDLRPEAIDAITKAAEARPWRWRQPTRRALAGAGEAGLPLVASLLERIGEPEDIGRLRDVARRASMSSVSRLGLSLARRLADKVFVEDLGRVQINIGARTVDGADVRRKVLALLCFLLSRPNFASTRDEVLDALWPEHDPPAALNSLNQTVYFLRRVFEPNFRDETSPGYVGQDGETIWLDAELIDCRSRQCLRLIRAMPRSPTPEGSIELAAEYRGRFSLDFAYEEWAVPYRDALHAAYLRIIEHSVRLDLDGGHLDRGTFIAERAAEVDPDSEEIQAALVRLYRHSGAHAAAAEQYAHYSQTLRDLGVEPPALADV
jgi:DNA-binding SARP family transcriptional activator/tetratricopeptide (TPR) repeat protein